MRIIYDHQIFGLQEFGGISRYFFELASRIPELGAHECRFPFPFSNNSYLGQPGPFQKPRFLHRQKWIRGRTRMLRAINRIAMMRAVSRADFDLFHPSFFDPWFLGRLRVRPFVLTVFDMIHEIFPQYYPSGDPTAANKALLIRRAPAIIAISHRTKADILRFHDVDERKIRVIHLADSFEGKATPRAVIGLPGRYLLFVGSRIRYKNFAPMVRALAPILSGDPSLFLICAGGGAFEPGEQSLFQSAGVEARISQISVGDEELAFLYSHAQALVYPSLYEGFGIPILEAFRMGCPVVLAGASCGPEIAGDAAISFEPGSPVELQVAVKRILEDGELRRVLVEKGRSRILQFSWDKTARETLEVYRMLYERGQAAVR